MLTALSMFTLPSLIPCLLNLQKQKSWAELTLLESRAAFFGGFCLNVLGVHMNSACLFLPPAAYCTNTQPWEDVGRQTVLRKNTHTHTPLSSVLSLLQMCLQLIKKSFVLALVLKKNKIMENAIVWDIQCPKFALIWPCLSIFFPKWI